MFKKSKQPARYACLRGSALDIQCGTPQWWFLPGCDHVGGKAQVCDPCKEQIDLGSHVPNAFWCPCGAQPTVIPVGGGR